MSHLYLDVSYEHFNSTNAINAVDMFIPSFVFGIVFNLLYSVIISYCINSKSGLCCTVCIGVLMIIMFQAVLLYIFILFKNATFVNVNVARMSNLIFLVYLYSFTGINSPSLYYLTVVFGWNNKLFNVILSMVLFVFYFLPFIGFLITLQFDTFNKTWSRSWEDTINYSNISVVNLIFVALQVAMNSFAFVLSLFVNTTCMANKYYAVNQLQERSDCHSMVCIIVCMQYHKDLHMHVCMHTHTL